MERTKNATAQPTHKDWEIARSRRDSAARLSIRALLDGKTDEATQQALKYDEQDDIMWSISRMLDGPCAGGDLG